MIKAVICTMRDKCSDQLLLVCLVTIRGYSVFSYQALHFFSCDCLVYLPCFSWGSWYLAYLGDIDRKVAGCKLHQPSNGLADQRKV